MEHSSVLRCVRAKRYWMIRSLGPMEAAFSRFFLMLRCCGPFPCWLRVQAGSPGRSAKPLQPPESKGGYVAGAGFVPQSQRTARIPPMFQQFRQASLHFTWAGLQWPSVSCTQLVRESQVEDAQTRQYNVGLAGKLRSVSRFHYMIHLLSRPRPALSSNEGRLEFPL